MANGQLSPVLRFIRRFRAAPPARADSDGLLLTRFIQEREETAFTALVERHGPMVLSVCRRLLAHWQDAEDAFQATFMVLARQAASIRKRDSVASWLYGVAYRVAHKAQAACIRRRNHERQVVTMPQEASLPESAWRELRAILDEELTRLPEKYRAPLVLCYLEGKTNEEAARQLGWTKGTVSGRLARARDLMRGRLARRGLTLSGSLLVGLWGAATAPAAVPGTLLSATVGAAVQFTGKAAVGVLSAPAAVLAKGVLQAMFVTKCKVILTAVLALGVLGAGTGVLSQRLLSAGPAEDQPITQLPAAEEQAVSIQETEKAPSQQAEKPPARSQEAEKPPKRNRQADKVKSANNLKVFGLAMHNYHDAYGHLPAAAICNNDGKPLLSWRVAILPFIEQDALFKAFKLDEPWDSEHNKKLLAQMPKEYAPPGIKTKEKHSTFYRVFVGPGTVFESKKGQRIQDIVDGTSNTLMVVEAGKAVPWTKPDELPYDKNKDVPKLGGIFDGDFNFLMADASVHRAHKGFNASVMHLLIQRNDGQVVDLNDLNKK